jgi:hypothetical protein
MRFFVCFIRVRDYESARSTLLNFKQKIKEQGEIEVIDTIQENYDFLLDSMIEKANNEKKGR